ncbi:MAG TPA: hypothetical protein VG122_11830 [Gemmata sp.]|nr:hypothetical protein [Gemmata sp.]
MPLTFVLPIAMVAFSPAVQTEPKETPIRLNVQQMAAPKPALRYLLLPELKEMTPGNPVEGYFKCLLDQDLSAEKEVFGNAALRQVDRAARMDKPDWQMRLAKTNEIGLSDSDVFKLLALAKGLQNRFRIEVAQRRFDDAIVTAKTMFAMSRHMGEHPRLIGNLVGVAIAQMAIGQLQEMLEQPGCPNLYWALTNLPSPLVSLDRSMSGLRAEFQNELRDLDDTAPMTPAQLKKLIAHIDQMRDLTQAPSKEKTQAWLETRTKDSALVVAARSRLVEYGIPEERSLKFPAEQLILLDEKRAFEVHRDEFMKLMRFAPWQIEEQAARIAQTKDELLFAHGVHLASLLKYRRDQAVHEQRFALLQHVEALRMYAAEHKGQLPEKLTDIVVLLPVDPFTGKPFRYTLEGATAHIRCNQTPGGEKIAAFNLHYEITISSRGK